MGPLIGFVPDANRIQLGKQFQSCPRRRPMIGHPKQDGTRHSVLIRHKSRGCPEQSTLACHSLTSCMQEIVIAKQLTRRNKVLRLRASAPKVELAESTGSAIKRWTLGSLFDVYVNDYSQPTL